MVQFLSQDLEKATAFNEFFSSASTVDDSQAQLPTDDSVLEGVSILSELVVTEQEVKDQLSLLNVNK